MVQSEQFAQTRTVMDELEISNESQADGSPPVEVPMDTTTVTNTTANRATYFSSEAATFNVDDTSKRFKYLLGLTDLFKHFIEAKAEKDANVRLVLDAIEQGNGPRGRKSEQEEDAELLRDEQDTANIVEFTESPAYVDGTLRPYQVQGLNWLISLYENNLNGILADEMGLGKTLQTIAFLGFLRYHKGINGPHIVIVPKSTLDNWAREFLKWTPDVRVLVIQGDKRLRHALINQRLMSCDFDVVITSYEIVIREKAAFRKFRWQYIVVDEAHRIKNEESLLSQIIRVFHSNHRLLITGTPLQNNLHELWALLNFILPDVFGDSQAFDQWFNHDTHDTHDKSHTNDDTHDKSEDVVAKLHKVLQPFLLRRIKADVEKSLLPKKEMNVYVKMSPMQKTWYQKILEKDIDAVNGANGKKESKTRLLNIVMQLRKCCNHPYLFEGAEPGPPYTTDEHLVDNAQKMVILDKLLAKFRKENSRVLIFSQMSRMLDILEDYCGFRGYEYCRIDGQTDHSDRVDAIDAYNAPGSRKFVFLLTTRAGGLGINLTTADIVILFDSDWNPQADLQAMDRAHRIGQTKQVKVFRLITENAIEEKVLERAAQKLRLDQLVIQQGRNMAGTGTQSTAATSKDELLNMIQFGAAAVFDNADNGADKTTNDIDIDIDELLAESETKTSALNQRYEKLNLNALQNFTNDESVYEWNGENFKKKDVSGNVGLGWINPGKRERKENYSVDVYYRDVLNPGRAAPAKPGPRPPKHITIYDHQFFPLKLVELIELEKNWYKQQVNYQPVGSDQQRQLEQQEIANARPLTEQERDLKHQLLSQGFGNWNRKEFQHFIALSTKYGRNSLQLIASEFDTKSIDDIRAYAQQFWRNYKEIDGYEKIIANIEAGEDRIRRIKLHKECLRRKLSQYTYPLQELVFKFPPAASNRKVWSEEEDRFLMVQMYKVGLDRPDVYDRLKQAIRDSMLFKFDFFLQSRTTAEIARRCQTLLGCVMREVGPKRRRVE